MSTRRQTRCDSFRPCQSTTPRQPQLTGDVLAGAYKNSSGSSTRRARASDLILRHRRFPGTAAALVGNVKGLPGLTAGGKIAS
jgi:hypothetical protein